MPERKPDHRRHHRRPIHGGPALAEGRSRSYAGHLLPAVIPRHTVSGFRRAGRRHGRHARWQRHRPRVVVRSRSLARPSPTSGATRRSAPTSLKGPRWPTPRFGYTPSALTSLVRDFRAGKLALFPEPGRPGRKTASKKHAGRARVITRRRQGLSVYEISARLAAEGSPLNRTGSGRYCVRNPR